MKTIKEYFENSKFPLKLLEPSKESFFRKKLLHNMYMSKSINYMNDLYFYDFNEKVPTIGEAINRGFVWEITFDGEHYWNDIWKQLTTNK
jgi:hypothetical protein